MRVHQYMHRVPPTLSLHRLVRLVQNIMNNDGGYSSALAAIERAQREGVMLRA